MKTRPVLRFGEESICSFEGKKCPTPKEHIEGKEPSSQPKKQCETESIRPLSPSKKRENGTKNQHDAAAKNRSPLVIGSPKAWQDWVGPQ